MDLLSRCFILAAKAENLLSPRDEHS